MGSTLVGLLPSAIAFALSPAAIIELILVLFSRRARVNGVVFLVSLVASVVVVTGLGAFAVSATTNGSTDQPSTIKGVVLALLGAAALFFAFRNWRNRTDASVPKAFDAIAGMGPFPVFVLAIGVAAFNPKNLIVLLAAGAQIGAAGEDTAAVLSTIVLFTLVATLPFSAAVAWVVFGGEGATRRLERVREWLMVHNRLIMAVVLVVLGVALLAQGIEAISG